MPDVLFSRRVFTDAERFQHDVSDYVAAHFTEDERVLAVLPLLLGQGQIVTGPARGLMYTDVWMYSRLEDALIAYKAWNGVLGTEPAGWTRHTSQTRPTRRRTYDAYGSLVSEEERP